MSQMDLKVFRDYTQAELDRNYDQRGWATDVDVVVQAQAKLNAAARASLECRRDLAYGSGPDEVVDWYPAARPAAPLVIYVHGGGWRMGSKDEHAFVAVPFVQAGIHCVVVNFSKTPAVRMSAMVAQLRRAVMWVSRHAEVQGADPARMFISGHSSGAHMVATALIEHADVTARFRAAFCISGAYDLEAVMLSARSSYLVMQGTEEDDLSPTRRAGWTAAKVLVVYADGDTDEFRRHSREYAAALRRCGLLIDCIELPNLDHFKINASLGDAASPLSRLLLQQIEVPDARALD